jgi:hypothetical protein
MRKLWCAELPGWTRTLMNIAFLLCLVGCAAEPKVAAKTAGEPAIAHNVEVTPFTASSLDNMFFAFVGEFQAGFHIGRDSISVLVSRARIRLREATTMVGPRVLDSIQVRLAHASGPTWAVTERSAPLVVGRRMEAGAEIQLDSLLFRMARPEAPIEQHWLVFELIGRLIGGDGRPGTSGSAYVHSDRNVFSQH